MKRLLLYIAVLLGLSLPTVSLAQTAPLTTEEGRADRARPATPSPAPAPTAQGQVLATAPAFTPFVLKGLQVDGSSLPQAVLHQAAQPYVGREITEADLVKIADAVGKLYAASDIALYTVLAPRQSGEGGLARLVAIEGFISDIKVTSGERGPPPSLTRAYGDRLLAEKPLTKSGLQRYVGLMRDIPGASIDVQLLQGARPGAVRLAVTTEIKRFQTTLSVNNRGAAFLGRTQIEASVSANSLFREGQQTRLTLAAPTEWERFQYVAISHSEPLGASGATLTVSGGHISTKPKIAGYEIDGSATTGAILLGYPVIRGNTRNLYASASLDGVDSDNALFGRRISREQTRVARVAATLVEQSPKMSASAGATLSQGVDGLGAQASPLGGKSDFSKINAQANYTQVAGTFVVRLSANAQYSSSRVPGPEQYALGGAQFGRAFASAVISGDSGYAGSVELAWRPAKTPKPIVGSELYGFADHGEVWSKARPAGSRSMALASAGVGARLAWAGRGMIELEVARPIDSPPGVSQGTQLMINLRSLL
jgi:hemolysin activation/secretion protein